MCVWECVRVPPTSNLLAQTSNTVLSHLATTCMCVCCGFVCRLQRWKLYFIGLHSSAPHEVDMSRIYSFDAQRQQMEAHTPRVLGAERQEDMVDPVMRIRWVAGAVRS